MKSLTKKLKYIESLLPDYITVENPYMIDNKIPTLLGVDISILLEKDIELNKLFIKRNIKHLLSIREDEVKRLKELDEKTQQQRKELRTEYDTIKISILRGDI